MPAKARIAANKQGQKKNKNPLKFHFFVPCDLLGSLGQGIPTYFVLEPSLRMFDVGFRDAIALCVSPFPKSSSGEVAGRSILGILHIQD